MPLIIENGCTCPVLVVQQCRRGSLLVSIAAILRHPTVNMPMVSHKKEVVAALNLSLESESKY